MEESQTDLLCPRRESNPHALMDTWPSTMPVYQFQHLGSKKKKNCDLAGARTQDPLLKREMLYQLSYQICYGACRK